MMPKRGHGSKAAARSESLCTRLTHPKSARDIDVIPLDPQEDYSDCGVGRLRHVQCQARFEEKNGYELSASMENGFNASRF